MRSRKYFAPYSFLAVSDSTGSRTSGFNNQTTTRAEVEEIETLQSLDEEDEEQVFPRALLLVDPADDVTTVELGEQTLVTSPSKRATSSKELCEEDEDDFLIFEETEEMIDALNFLERKATEDMVKKDIKDSERKWGKATAAQAFAFDARNMVMYTGDTMGNLRSFDLRDGACYCGIATSVNMSCCSRDFVSVVLRLFLLLQSDPRRDKPPHVNPHHYLTSPSPHPHFSPSPLPHLSPSPLSLTPLPPPAAVNTAMTALIKATTSFVTEKTVVQRERRAGAYAGRARKTVLFPSPAHAAHNTHGTPLTH